MFPMSSLHKWRMSKYFEIAARSMSRDQKIGINDSESQRENQSMTRRGICLLEDLDLSNMATPERITYSRSTSSKDGSRANGNIRLKSCRNQVNHKTPSVELICRSRLWFKSRLIHGQTRADGFQPHWTTCLLHRLIKERWKSPDFN